MPLGQFADRFPALVRRLCQSRLQERIGHAWVFTGDDMPFLKSFVTAWVQVAVCTDSRSTGDACGTCDDCRRIAGGTYPHLHVVHPYSKTRQILVDRIRELERALSLKAGGKRKVGLLYHADRMLPQAQNAFLKTLEEPAGDTILILITTNSEGLLPTIRSRCQYVSLRQNSHCYAFPGYDELLQVLGELRAGVGAAVAIRAAENIQGILERLEQESEESDETSTGDPAPADVTEDRAFQSKLEAQRLAKQAAHQAGNRDLLISAIHTWFAQEFMRSLGVDTSSLPNSEMYAPPASGGAPDTLDALQNLQVSEDLVRSTQLNVQTQLAIQDFCQRITRRQVT